MEESFGKNECPSSLQEDTTEPHAELASNQNPTDPLDTLGECLQESLKINNQSGLSNPKTLIDFPGISNEKVYDEEDFASCLPRSFRLPEGIWWSHIPTDRKLEYLHLQAIIDVKEGYVEPFIDESAFVSADLFSDVIMPALTEAHEVSRAVAEMCTSSTPENYFETLKQTMRFETANDESNDQSLSAPYEPSFLKRMDIFFS